jgi:hypothetical protein
MSVTFKTTGSGVSGSTSVAPAPNAGNLPVAGDRSIMIVGTKPDTATIATPAGWTLIGQATGGTGSQAADTGTCRIAAFYRDDAFSGAQTVTITNGNSSLGVIVTYSKSLGGWAAIAFTTGDDTTTGDATYSAACAADPGITAGDALLAGIHIPTDACTIAAGSALGSPSITATSLTGGTTGSAYNETGTGNDAGGGIIRREGFTGTAASVATVAATFTGATNTAGPTILVRLRDELTITPAAVTVTATAGTLTISQDQAVTPAAVTVTATAGTLVVTPPPQAVTPAATTVSATPGSLAIAREEQVTPGAVTVSVTPGALSVALSGGEEQAVTPAAVTVSVTPGSLALVREEQIAPEAVTVSVTLGSLGVAREEQITPASVTTDVTPGSLALVREEQVAPAAVTVSVTPGTTLVEIPPAVDPVGAVVTVAAGSLIVLPVRKTKWKAQLEDLRWFAQLKRRKHPSGP